LTDDPFGNRFLAYATQGSEFQVAAKAIPDFDEREVSNLACVCSKFRESSMDPCADHLDSHRKGLFVAGGRHIPRLKSTIPAFFDFPRGAAQNRPLCAWIGYNPNCRQQFQRHELVGQ
jgi:hypothetical protein